MGASCTRDSPILQGQLPVRTDIKIELVPLGHSVTGQTLQTICFAERWYAFVFEISVDLEEFVALTLINRVTIMVNRGKTVDARVDFFEFVEMARNDDAAWTKLDVGEEKRRRDRIVNYLVARTEVSTLVASIGPRCPIREKIK